MNRNDKVISFIKKLACEYFRIEIKRIAKKSKL